MPPARRSRSTPPGGRPAAGPRPRHPALALLELSRIATGIATADRMIKRAPIALLKVGTVQPGHYLILIGGSVAATEEAYREGLDAAGTDLIGQVLLCDVDPQVHDTVLGRRRAPEAEALGVLETRGAAALLRATDAAVKGAAVTISELRLADGLGGHGIALFDGAIPDVEAALEIAVGCLEAADLLQETILRRLDEALRTALGGGTRFATSELIVPEGAE